MQVVNIEDIERAIQVLDEFNSIDPNDIILMYYGKKITLQEERLELSNVDFVKKILGLNK